MKANLMREYHQPHSEIEKMSFKDIIFYIVLLEAESDHEEQLMG
jgi:hypothetical protein